PPHNLIHARGSVCWPHRGAVLVFSSATSYHPLTIKTLSTSRLHVHFAPSTHLPLLLSNPSLSVHPRTPMQRREYPHKLPTSILTRGAHKSRHKAVRPNQEHAMSR